MNAESPTTQSHLSLAPPGFVEAHAELHHYTSFSGLKGIVESRTLWATHYLHLNDSTELALLESAIVNASIPRVEVILKKRPELNHLVQQYGGVERVAKDITSSFISVLYNVGFRGKGAVALAEPYVVSFCTHDHLYERNNGLLSQWRAYGREGYCIVFDSDALLRLLSEERERYYWVDLTLRPVIYSGEEMEIANVFPKLLSSLDHLFCDLLAGKEPSLAEDPFEHLLPAAPFFKHRGFQEEREVRIVAAPANNKTVEVVRARHNDFTPLLLKPVNQRHKAESTTPYLALFDGIQEKLPIKRVIVGPSRRQRDNIQQAGELLGDVIKLVNSDTPFIG